MYSDKIHAMFYYFVFFTFPHCYRFRFILFQLFYFCRNSFQLHFWLQSASVHVVCSREGSAVQMHPDQLIDRLGNYLFNVVLQVRWAAGAGATGVVTTVATRPSPTRLAIRVECTWARDETVPCGWGSAVTMRLSTGPSSTNAELASRPSYYETTTSLCSGSVSSNAGVTATLMPKIVGEWS